MMLHATITFLNFGLARAVGFRRGFSEQRAMPRPNYMQTLGHRFAWSFNPCAARSGKQRWISFSGDNRHLNQS